MNQILQSSRPLWLNVLILLVLTSLIGLFITLVSNVSLSNVYFLAGILYLLISVVPAFSEMGSNAKSSRQALKQGKNPLEIIQEQEKEGKYKRGSRVTFLFGFSGFLCFVLAVFTI